jgi:hypothetical protein
MAYPANAPDSPPCNSDATTSTRPESSVLLVAGLAAMSATTGTRSQHTYPEEMNQLPEHSTEELTREEVANVIEDVLAMIEEDISVFSGLGREAGQGLDWQMMVHQPPSLLSSKDPKFWKPHVKLRTAQIHHYTDGAEVADFARVVHLLNFITHITNLSSL